MADQPNRSRRPTAEAVAGSGGQGAGERSRSREAVAKAKGDSATLILGANAPRAVRSTRTPAISRDGEPHRSTSATTPAGHGDLQTRTAATHAATLPPPSTRQRTASDSPKQASSRSPAAYNTRNPLAGTDYKTEPLGGNETPWLALPSASRSMGDVRQSGSSFQTEPSSYYSAADDEAANTNPPPPPMPVPQRGDSHGDARYESLWRAAQAPEMPRPSASAPGMPSPYTREESTSMYADTSEGGSSSPDVRPVRSGTRELEELYESPWLAAAPPMPMPSLPSPPTMPTPRANVRAPSPHNQAGDGLEYTSEEQSPVVPSTAPLRIHHARSPSAASTTMPQPAGQPAMPHPEHGEVNDNQGMPSNTGSLPRPGGMPRPEGGSNQSTVYNAGNMPRPGGMRRPDHSEGVSNQSTAYNSGNMPRPAGMPRPEHGEGLSNESTVYNSGSLPRPGVMPRPDGAAKPFAGQSTASSSGSQSKPTAARPSAQGMEFNSPNTDMPKPQGSARPTAAFARPTASGAPAPRPTPISQSSSRYESNTLPPAPKPPAPTPTPPSNPNQVHTSIYAQHATTRPTANPASSTAPVHTSIYPQYTQQAASRPDANASTNATPPVVSKPQNTPTRIESKPPATSLRPNTLGGSQKPVPVQSHAQPPPRTESVQQPAKPTGTAASTFSSAVAPKPHSTQVHNAQTQPTRPHVVETPRPQATPPPAPKPPPPTANAKLQHKEDVAAAAAASLAAAPSRPHLHGSKSQMDTQYVNMMLALDDIPALHNLAASFFAWILLAGFILFPGTFSNLETLSAQQTNAVAQQLIHKITSLPLFIVAWVCTGIGCAGLLWLCVRWRKNYLFGLNKIFLPGLMNSLAGLLSTIANIFGTQDGQFNKNSKIILIVTGVATAIFALLTAFYALWLIRRVKARHDRTVGRQTAGKHGEGAVDVSTRRI